MTFRQSDNKTSKSHTVECTDYEILKEQKYCILKRRRNSFFVQQPCLNLSISKQFLPDYTIKKDFWRLVFQYKHIYILIHFLTISVYNFEYKKHDKEFETLYLYTYTLYILLELFILSFTFYARYKYTLHLNKKQVYKQRKKKYNKMHSSKSDFRFKIYIYIYLF